MSDIWTTIAVLAVSLAALYMAITRHRLARRLDETEAMLRRVQDEQVRRALARAKARSAAARRGWVTRKGERADAGAEGGAS